MSDRRKHKTGPECERPHSNTLGAMSGKLTLKQQAFCQAYLETGNGAEAYRMAYNTRARPQVCADKAWQLLSRVDIGLRVEELQAGVDTP